MPFLRMNNTYVFGYIMWSNFVVNGVLPFLVLLFLNIFIFKSINKMQVCEPINVNLFQNFGFKTEERNLNTSGLFLETQRSKEMKLAQVSLAMVFGKFFIAKCNMAEISSHFVKLIEL